MSLLKRLFGPKIPKLEEQGDVDGLIAVVESDASDEVRISALQALARIDGEQPVAALITALTDTSAGVASAAEELVSGAGSAAAGPLVDSLAGDAGERAIAMLLDLGGAAVEPLRGASTSTEEEARQRALTGLLELEERLPEPEVRETVFRTLLASLGDRSPACRVVAASGLQRLGDERASRALAAQLKDGDEGVRSACCRALSGIGEPAVPHLAYALGDRNSNSRRLAAELLGTVCAGGVEPGACGEALAALVSRAWDGDPEVKAAVRAALDRVPADGVVEEQLELLADPERSDRDEVLELLQKLLENASVDADLRTAAVERIAELGFSTPD